MVTGLVALLLLVLLLPRATTFRLDATLVSRGFVGNRAAAKKAIQNGRVMVNGKIVLKPAFNIETEDHVIEVAAPDPNEDRFVSRAGEKLSAALEAFKVDLVDAALLDVGASTGGFTDCALQAGAASAVCVDCGHKQLHRLLKADPRVQSFEGVNARYLTASQLPRSSFDCVVVDVSFISLRLVLPAIWPLLCKSNPRARLVCLVKPQFEVGKEAVSKGNGLVKDRALCVQSLADVIHFARSELWDCTVTGSIESPIAGGKGQLEFLLALAHASHQPSRSGHDIEIPEGSYVRSLRSSIIIPKPQSAASRAADYRNRKLEEVARRQAAFVKQPEST